jgi:hypothetical protein
MSSII